MELNYMLSYGAMATEPSLRLLQRFHLLEIFVPFHVTRYWIDVCTLSYLLQSICITRQSTFWKTFGLQAAYLSPQTTRAGQSSIMLMVCLLINFISHYGAMATYNPFHPCEHIVVSFILIPSKFNWPDFCPTCQFLWVLLLEIVISLHASFFYFRNIYN